MVPEQQVEHEDSQVIEDDLSDAIDQEPKSEERAPTIPVPQPPMQEESKQPVGAFLSEKNTPIIFKGDDLI